VRIRSLTIELCCIVICLVPPLAATYCSTANALQSSATDQKEALPDAPKPRPNNNIRQSTRADWQRPAKAPAEHAWPRAFTSDNDKFNIYQPQVDSWEANQIHLYSAVELKTGNEAAARYGVVWFQARTEVDKVNRMVTFDQAKVTEVKFPAAHEKESELISILEKRLPTVTKNISLDRLEAELDANDDVVKRVEVKNDPPKVIIARKPSVQVLIDGAPQMRGVPGTKLQRVINTRSIILFDEDKKLYFLRVQDWWLQSKELEDSWKYAKKLPDDMKKAEEYIVSQNIGQDPEGAKTKQQPSLKESGKNGDVPDVYVVYGPTELIETTGDPKFTPIPGTGLEFAANTSGNIFRLGTDYYILVSGRWFKNPTLDGPWTFVDSQAMPADFAKIPADSPKSTVLASVP